MVAALTGILLAISFLFTNIAYAGYASTLCKSPEYSCYTVKKGDSWKKLFPEEDKRDLVMRINKINVKLYRGRTIAIPNSVSLNMLDYSPIPTQIDPPGVKLILVTLHKHIFGAYNANGTLERWGPVSGAKGYCPDIHRGCHTPVGRFSIQSREGADCKSTKYPVGRGGAPMPYCMFFHKGFALHGSYDVPGYNASHGCVRLFVNDARWLNNEFTAGERTKVIIEP